MALYKVIFRFFSENLKVFLQGLSMKDVLIPIVFPEYKITVDTPRKDVDLIPWVSFDNFTIQSSTQKLSNLGHAGILIVNGISGLTKYYEFGRYDYPEEKGIVRRVPVPDAKVSTSGVEPKSLISVLDKVSKIAGRATRIEGVYIEATDVFEKLNQKVILQKAQNNNPNRKEYDLTSNSCIHFVKRLVEAAGKETPWMIDPRPASYIGEFRDDYRDLDYYPSSKRLVIEAVGEYS
ncbi:hypothetical protein Q4601_09010 [Shewanella sp. 1_MG-2023]|uniref:hypothetical protein n=1 Tax=unclassified Shewanella TaxID=196818 RepID=UPI0026E3D597|nr:MULTISPECIES: hypothetical protein [unclassified Shewanella]MDO6610432.1 hypothetical protein [Shewanella sp. 7_MG-2023]MDO6770557.1 hypothetical protein [Shewanella sp. 2_MG-2023]MDO6794444.1 hypothetical protein [Shewanella sp. 1_MG-2023]